MQTSHKKARSRNSAQDRKEALLLHRPSDFSAAGNISGRNSVNIWTD